MVSVSDLIRLATEQSRSVASLTSAWGGSPLSQLDFRSQISLTLACGEIAGATGIHRIRHCFESGDPGFQRCTLLKVLMWPTARTIVGRPIHFITGEKCFNLVLNINIIFGAHRYKPRPRFTVAR